MVWGAGEVITLYSDAEVAAGLGVARARSLVLGGHPWGGVTENRPFILISPAFFVQFWGLKWHQSAA